MRCGDGGLMRGDEEWKWRVMRGGNGGVMRGGDGGVMRGGDGGVMRVEMEE